MSVKYILVTGVWHVNGLNCNDRIVGQVYIVPEKSLKREVKTDLKQKYVSDQTENNAAKMYKDDDAVVVKGTVPGENIQVYTTMGTLVYSTVANDEVVRIKVPMNQFYVVKLAQACYKVSM